MIDIYLLRKSLRDLMRPRKLIAALILMAAPGMMILLLKELNGHRHVERLGEYGMMTEKVVFGFVLVILTLVFCTSVVAQEVEDKTIAYLLTRPVQRVRILAVKVAPALIVSLVTVWISLLITALAAFGPGGLSGTPLARDIEIAPVGVLAYGTSFTLLATLLNRPLVVGLFYTFGWESWVPNLPGNFQKLSLMAYLRVLAPHGGAEPKEIDVTQIVQTSASDTITSHLAWVVLICVIVVALAGSIYAFSVREYVPRDVE